MTQGTYWLTVLPETSKLRPGIKRALAGVDQDAKIRPTIDTKDARKAGQQVGRDVQAGVESTTRGGGLGKMLRIDGARTAGQNAGKEINAGIASADIGRGAAGQLDRNMTSGAAGLGRRLGSMIGGGLKIAAVGAGTVAAAGLGAALTAGFKRLTAIDDAKFKLQGLGNSTEKVQGIMDNALAAVKGTAFGLDEAATTAATAVAAGIQPGEQLTGYLKLTADTAAIAGTSLADMGGIFNSVQTSGKAMTGDLRMLADRGLPVFTWLQEATGKTGEEFQKFVEDGGVSSEMFRDAVAKNIGGAAQAMGGSVRGSLSNLKASFSRFGAELSGPIFAGLKPLAIGLTGVFDSVTTAIKPIMADLTATVGPWAEQMAAKMKAWADNGGMEKVVGWFGRMRDTIAGLTSGGGSGAMTSIADSAKQLAPALQNAGPALQGIGDSMKVFGQSLMQIGPEVLTGVLVPALQLLAGALKFVADNASWAVPVVGGLVLAIGGMSAATKTLLPIFSAMNNGLKLINAPLIMAQNAAIRAQAAAMTQLTAALGANTVAATTNTVAGNANAATTIRGRIAAVASAAAQKAVAIGTAAWTGAQWLLNAALTANPIGLVVVAVAALVAGIIYAYKHSETFRNIVQGAWTGIKAAASAVVSWFTNTAWPFLKQVWEGIGAGWQWLVTTAEEVGAGIRDRFNQVVDFFKGLPSAISNAAKGMWEGLKTGLVEALRWIANKWNSLSSALSFTIPDWVPGVGGNKWQLPQIPGFAGGSAGVNASGVISGPGTGTSDSILALVSNGEGIVKESAMAGGGAPVVAALNAGWVPSPEYLRGMLPGFADGKGPDISVAEGLAGTPYSQGQRFDCSGTVARVINGALGQGGGLMSTKNARQWLSERGFVDGTGERGQISVGWYDHGPNPNDGHMAMTLSDGRNAESGGKNGAFTIGAGAAGADDPQFDNHMYLPQMYGEGAGASGSLGSSTSASAGSSRAVQSAKTSLTNAGQAVDDRTYARDQAQQRLDDAKAKGKGVDKAQHSLDVANRELADAKERQGVASDRLAEVENKAATDADKSTKSSTGGGFDDLGKSLWGGLMETIGLDGSVFSNPFEWPTIKSVMAGVNVLGKALSGGSDSATSGTGGAGGDPTGPLDMLTNLNPATADVAAAPASAVAPDTTQHGTGGGANPGPAVVIENAGMSPTDVSNRLTADFNARTRTTKVH
ncbi:tape measure protein [Mycobacterium syngnathidarum]